jgi:dATP pyrophosphohydrolase
MPTPYKLPQSVLVVIYTPAWEVLLIRRTEVDQNAPAFWQSVTGSKDTLRESFAQTAAREVLEETGIDCALGAPLHGCLHDWELENTYAIYPRWLHRYAPGVTHNVEHVFGLQVPIGTPVQLNPREHTDFQWLPHRQAAQQCFSPSNAEAILLLPRFAPKMRSHSGIAP